MGGTRTIFIVGIRAAVKGYNKWKWWYGTFWQLSMLENMNKTNAAQPIFIAT